MITGLVFEITSAELKAHCEGQAQAHAVKVGEYEKSIEGVRRLQEDARHTSMDAGKDLAGRMAQHKARVQYFTFCAAHIIRNETYRLSESDLNTIGFVERSGHW
jgi:hypothetical protein